MKMNKWKGHGLTGISLVFILLILVIASSSVFAKEGDAHAPGIGKIGGDHWIQRLTVSGLAEVAYGSAEDYAGKSSSDIALAKVELAFDAKVNEKVNAHLAFLHEEDDTDYSVDSGFIDVALGQVNLQAGLMGVPFGSYETNLISDTLTLEVGDTKESVVMLSSGVGNVNASVYVFNGATQETGADDGVDQMGVSVSYVAEGKYSSMDIGVDYLNNIGGSGAVAGAIEANTGGELKQYVSAQVIHANFSYNYVHIILEHLTTDKFDATEVPFNAKGAEITATNIELGYSFLLAGVESTIALGMQTTEEALAFELPEERTLLGLSMNVYQDTALSFEYSTSTDYSIADGGTGKDETASTVKLSVGF